MTIKKEKNKKDKIITVILKETLTDNNITVKELSNSLNNTFPKEALELSTLYTYCGDNPKIPSVENLHKIRIALERATGKNFSLDDLIHVEESHQSYIARKNITEEIEESRKTLDFIKPEIPSCSKKKKIKREKEEFLKKILKRIGKESKNNLTHARLRLKLADICYLWGDYKWSEKLYRWAEDWAKKKEIHIEQVQSLIGQANVAKKVQEHEKAFKICQVTLNLLRSKGSRENNTLLLEASLLRIQGDCLRKIGFGHNTYYKIALHILDDIISREASNLKGHIKNGIGILLRENGKQFAQAIICHKEAIAFFKESKNKRNESWAQIYLARALYKRSLTVEESRRKGFIEEAKDIIQKAQNEFSKAGDRAGVADCHYTRGLVEDNRKLAMDSLKNAIVFYKGSDSSQDKRSIFYTLLLQGKVAENLDEEESYLDDAEDLLEDIEDYRGKRYFYARQSNFYIEKMRSCIDKSKRIAFRRKAETACQNIFDIQKEKKTFTINLEISKNQYVKVEEYVYSLQESQYTAHGYLNLSYVFLDKVVYPEEDEETNEKENKNLTEALHLIMSAIPLFEDYDHEFNKGRCYVQRAKIVQKQSEILNVPEAPAFLKKQENYLYIAKKSFEKIERSKWVNIVDKEINTLKTRLKRSNKKETKRVGRT